jgi:hypothetical protein
VVEESGDPVELGVRLRDLKTMQAVHLSCHGLNYLAAQGPTAG